MFDLVSSLSEYKTLDGSVLQVEDCIIQKAVNSAGGQEGDRCDVTTDCGDHMVCSTTCTCDVNYAVTPLKTCGNIS